MRYPEATAIETFLIFDWCQFIVATNRIPNTNPFGVSSNLDYLELMDDEVSDVLKQS